MKVRLRWIPRSPDKTAEMVLYRITTAVGFIVGIEPPVLDTGMEQLSLETAWPTATLMSKAEAIREQLKTQFQISAEVTTKESS